MSLFIESLAIPEVKVIRTVKYGDCRGFFSETYSRFALAAADINIEFVQDNHAMSVRKGIVRGLHFQTPPFAQDKLVRVASGAIFDVAVDIRAGSPTYGKHISVLVSAEAWNQVLIPVGFAHGFATLEPETEVIYKVSNIYSPEHDQGLLWNDPALGISWPVSAAKAILSDKDKRQPALRELPDYFRYEHKGKP